MDVGLFEAPQSRGDNASGAEQRLLAYLESQKFLNASTNATKLISRLRSDIQYKQLYQIHQDLRNIYFRFSNHKEKIDALADLLYYGSIHLLTQKELITGQDIAMLLVEVSAKHLQNLVETDGRREPEARLLNQSIKYHKENKTIPYQICQRLATIATSLPDTELGKQKFVAEILKSLTPKILNRDLLHCVLACSFWHYKEYSYARYHFLQGATDDTAEIVGQFLVAYQNSKSIKSEVDLFLAQFIFQLLSLQSPIDSVKPPSGTGSGGKQEGASNFNTGVTRKMRRVIRSIAGKVFSNYTMRHPLLRQAEIPFPSSPLLNFTYFIITILDRNPPELIVYKALCDIYKVAWSRDPNYQTYLNRIGMLYFGLVDKQKQQQQHGGFFQEMLMSLFEGNDEGEHDSNEDEESNLSNNMSLCDDLD